MTKNIPAKNIKRRLPVASRNARKALATGSPHRPGGSVITTTGIFRHSGFSVALMFDALTSVPGLQLSVASRCKSGMGATAKGRLPAKRHALCRFREVSYPYGTGRDRTVTHCLFEMIKGGLPMDI